MVRKTALVVVAAALFSPLSARAGDAVVTQMLGNGLHAYYSHNYTAAFETLSSVIAGGCQDPRAYYFRGLALLRLGADDSAAADFQKGAELESAGMTQVMTVARALERVQGSDRATLEQFRATARMTAARKEEALRKQRYEEARQEQMRALREAEVVPAAPAVPLAAPGAKNPADAFQTGTIAEPKPPAEEKVALPAADVPAADAPAAAEAAPAMPAEPAAAEPAAEPAVEDKPAAKAAAKAPAKAEENPFGDDKPAAPAKAAEKKPTAKAAAKAEENPFGDDKPAAPAKPAAKAAAEPAADAAEKPAEKPAEEPAAKAGAKPAAKAEDNPFN